MSSLFPGMNPYLEHPALWPGVHLLLIAALNNFLTPLLRPKYRVAVEVRVYNTTGESLLVGIPDVTVSHALRASSPVSNIAVAERTSQPQKVDVPMPEIIKQGYLEIREVSTREVVTVIELLSPVNKRFGDGREIYENKRLNILGSSTHLVEIDLLRNGQPMPIIGDNIKSDYRILVSRGDCRPQADLYGFNLPDQIPLFPLPLKSGDVEPMIDLKGLLDNVYEQGGYDLEINYQQDPIPPLSPEYKAWFMNIIPHPPTPSSNLGEGEL